MTSGASTGVEMDRPDRAWIAPSTGRDPGPEGVPGWVPGREKAAVGWRGRPRRARWSRRARRPLPDDPVGLPAQDLGRHRPRARAVVGPLGHEREDQGLELFGDRRIAAPGRGRLRRGMLRHDRHRRPRERSDAGHRLVDHDSQGIQVAAEVELAAPGLLRAHVQGRPPDDARVVPLLDEDRQPEVRELGRVGGGQQDVPRLDVAVDDALVMGVVQRLGDLGEDPQPVLHRQLPPPPGVAGAVDLLHDQVAGPVGRPEVVDATTFSWRSRAAIWASSRSFLPTSSPLFSLRTLMATLRWRTSSVAE